MQFAQIVQTHHRIHGADLHEIVEVAARHMRIEGCGDAALGQRLAPLLQPHLLQFVHGAGILDQ